MSVGDHFNFVPNQYNFQPQESNKKLFNSHVIEPYLPEVFGGSKKWLRRFEPDNKIIDKTSHQSGIRSIWWDYKNQSIFLLENFTNVIKIYSFSGEYKRDITSK